LIDQVGSNTATPGVTGKKGKAMKDRWQKSLEAAVAAYDTPMPWERGAQRAAMISRRRVLVGDANRPQPAQNLRA